jgi:hypothetical protein
MDWQLCGSGPEALQVNEEHFQKATSHPTSHMYADGGTRRQTENESAVSPAFANDTAVAVPPRGVELAWDFAGDSDGLAQRGANSGAVAADASLLDALRLLVRMTEAQRQALLKALEKAPKAAE